MPAAEPMFALIAAMANEVRMTVALQGLEPQFHRRLLVRVIFSVFEGFAYYLRQRSLDIGTHLRYSFSRAELENLKEQKERTKADGTIETRSFFLKSQQGLIFSINLFARVLDAPPPAQPQPADLETGFAIRDRLTHPKNTAAFIITEAECLALGRLSTWFSEVAGWYATAERAYIARVQESISSSIDAQIQRMNAAIQKPTA